MDLNIQQIQQGKVDKVASDLDALTSDVENDITSIAVLILKLKGEIVFNRILIGVIVVGLLVDLFI